MSVGAATSCAKDSAWPTFCSIPRVPTDRPTPQAIHAVVLDTRLAGRDVEQATAPGTFTLDDTEGFADRASREAAAPPPITTPSEADTATFEQKARAAAAAPSRRH